VEDPQNYCTACFDGRYPVDPFASGEPDALRRASLDPDGVERVEGLERDERVEMAKRTETMNVTRSTRPTPGPRGR
jgi:hypothetical protein